MNTPDTTKTHIMLDLETFGLAPYSAIISIGAVKFGKGQIIDTFYRNVDLQSCVDMGLKIDAETVMWWLKQNTEARQKLVSEKPEHISVAIYAFNIWMGEGDMCLWGNGAAFDNVLLACACEKTRYLAKWAHRQSYCYRTAKMLHPDVPFEREGTAHSAIDDAISQAKHLMKIFPNL